MHVAMDIETVGNPDMLDKLPPVDVKYGNTKDPLKRAEMDQAARESQIEKMGLDPLLGRIICISFVSADKRHTRIIDEISEAQEIALIQEAMSVLGKDDIRLVTWNGSGFDLPYIYKRCLALGINPGHFGAPPLTAWTKRYSVERHADLMQVFSGFGAHQYHKLDDVAGAILGERKNEIDVMQFPEMMKTKEGRDTIAKYCEQDTALTYSLFERMQGVLFV